MSASERLEALQAAAERDGYDNDLHGEPLLLALPALIALCRAAERNELVWNEIASEAVCPDCGYADRHDYVGEPCLGVTLTTLSDALGGEWPDGDEVGQPTC